MIQSPNEDSKTGSHDESLKAVDIDMTISSKAD